MLAYVYVGMYKISPSLNPNQCVKVRSPKSRGIFYTNSQKIMPCLLGNLSPSIPSTYSVFNGNLFSPPPIVSNLGSSSGFLVMGHGNKVEIIWCFVSCGCIFYESIFCGKCDLGELIIKSWVSVLIISS